MIKAGLFNSLIVCGLIIFSSCASHKSVTYFQDFTDTSRHSYRETVAFKSPVIQPDDILIITVQTEDNTVTSILNTTASGQEVPNGYLVDKDGTVKLPFIGKIKVTGLTTKEASDLIEEAVNKQFNNATVNVRFGNFKITVLGEVGRPSTYIMPNEKVNIFDVVGMAGDITLYGERDNVILLRDSLQGKTMVRLNLDSKQVVSSPYFFLKPNDMVYVPPSKSRVKAINANSNAGIRSVVSIAVAIVTLTFLIIDRL
jgi:polysaccharide export outer membrane protein